MTLVLAVLVAFNLLRSSDASRVRPSALLQRQGSSARAHKRVSSVTRVGAVPPHPGLPPQRVPSGPSSHPQAEAPPFTSLIEPDAKASQSANSQFFSFVRGVDSIIEWAGKKAEIGKAMMYLIVISTVLLLCAFCCCSCCCRFSGDKKRQKQKRAHFANESPPRRNDAVRSGTSASASSDGKRGSGKDVVFEERAKYMDGGQCIFEWSQTSSMITLHYPSPAGFRQKDLEVVFMPNAVKIGRVGSEKPFFLQNTYAAVNTVSSRWRLRSSGELEICICKARKGRWTEPFERREIDPGHGFPPIG